MARAMYLDVNYLQQEVYCVITILIIRSLGEKVRNKNSSVCLYIFGFKLCLTIVSELENKSTQKRKFVLFDIVLSPFMVMYQCLNGGISLKECSIMAPTIIE